MRRSRAVDWWLLATLLPAYVLMQAVAIDGWLLAGGRSLPFRVTGAQGARGYPFVRSVNVSNLAIQPGDRVLRVGDLDLRGLSRAEIAYRTVPLRRAGLAFEVEVVRNETRFTTSAEPIPNRSWWWPIPAWASFALAALFLLLRAPHWHLARPFFALALLFGCYGASVAPVRPSLAFIGYTVANSSAVGLSLWVAFGWTESAKPGRWLRMLPWAIALPFAAATALSNSLTLPTGSTPHRLEAAIPGVFIALVIAGLARAYLRSERIERRQLRWIVLGNVIGTLPRGVLMLADAVAPIPNLAFWSQLSFIFVMAIPLGIAISVVGYHWLDIDRLISASAAATLLGIALLGGALAVVPPVAREASAAVGIDPEAGRLALSMFLAAVLVPAYRGLRPWLDRRMFAERHELTLRFERLRSELAACRGAEELTRRAGEGIDALLRPDSIATYARAGEAFTPVFVRGRNAPPAFETKSALVQVLEAKAAPLFARDKALAPFERAALETLGAEVVVPVLRDGQLLAFTCLATKRSGDIYTATDLGLLAAIAERSSEVIARLDADEVTRQAQAMQSALRRYVPGAVAERVLAGDALEPAEREVSVLFVDIRDYTRVTEGLEAADVFATLNEHTERVSRIVSESGGTIVEFNGDGLMAVFGAPEALARKEQQAVEAARRIVDSMPAALAVGVGVATGPAFVGSIRSTDRLIWSAVGGTTNLASRLQSLTRELAASIALDETTRERAGYVCPDFVRHQGVAIRGRLGRFDVFALPLRGTEGTGFSGIQIAPQGESEQLTI